MSDLEGEVMAEKKEKSSARNYKVLHVAEGAMPSPGNDELLARWQEVAMIEASSADQAIRLVATEKGAGRYVAVPERSWSEMNVRVITVAPRLELDEVGTVTTLPAKTEKQTTLA